MSEPTPGPWQWELNNISDDEVWYGKLVHYSMKDGRRGLHEEVLTAMNEFDEAAIEVYPADARLIAVAPELLEACKAALATLEEWQCDDGGGDDASIHACREAIQRVESKEAQR